MARPASLPTWATDGGTTTEPTSGQKAAGWSAGYRPPAKWFNWWQNLTYQWCAYLNNLHNDADFLGEDYSWTGAHDFTDITIPSNGDGISIGGVNFEKELILPATAFQFVCTTGATPDWSLYSGGTGSLYWVSQVNSGYLVCSLSQFLPTNCEVRKFDVIVDPGAARSSTNRMSVALVRKTPNFSTHAYSNSVEIAATYDDTTNAAQTISVAAGATNYAVDKQTDELFLMVKAGHDAATNPDGMLGARVLVRYNNFCPW